MNFRSAKILTTLMLLILSAAGCGSDAEPEAKLPEPTLFPASDVCNYTQAGPGRVFERLGGGTWGQPNASEPRSPFECVGTTPQIRLPNTGAAVIEVQYIATGTETGASLVSLTYTASGGGPGANETTWRNAFANLVEAVTQQGLASAPPELFRRKLANLSSYSPPGKGFTENFDIGKGFMSITRESGSATDIKIYVKIFPDTALKLDS